VKIFSRNHDTIIQMVFWHLFLSHRLRRRSDLVNKSNLYQALSSMMRVITDLGVQLV